MNSKWGKAGCQQLGISVVIVLMTLVINACSAIPKQKSTEPVIDASTETSIQEQIKEPNRNNEVKAGDDKTPATTTGALAKPTTGSPTNLTDYSNSKAQTSETIQRTAKAYPKPKIKPETKTLIAKPEPAPSVEVATVSARGSKAASGSTTSSAKQTADVVKLPQPAREPKTTSTTINTSINASINKTKNTTPMKPPTPVVEKGDKVETTTVALSDALETQTAQTLVEVSQTAGDVTLEALPLTFGAWKLDLSRADEPFCFLRSATFEMDDGQGKTKVFAELNQQRFYIKTKSNIDKSYADTGIKVDSGLLWPIEKVYRETGIVYEQNLDGLISELKTGTTLYVSLGFWPTWPVTQAYAAEIPLQAFLAAYSGLSQCNRLL